MHTCKSSMQTFNAFLYTAQKRLEATSSPNCSLYKTIFTSFNALLFTTQNRHANVQYPFAHGAKPPCKRSKSFCSLCKTSMQMFRTSLFMIQNYIPLLPLHFSVNGFIHELSGDTRTLIRLVKISVFSSNELQHEKNMNINSSIEFCFVVLYSTIQHEM